MKKLITSITLVGTLAVLLQCSAIDYRARPAASDYPRTESRAIAQTVDTPLGKALKISAQKHKGQSGFRILDKGRNSLAARIYTIRAAQKTLDLQYYAVHDDVTSNLLVESIIQAAERGVRVRFLLDDISAGDVRDSLSVLDDMDNVEVRIFNPMTTKDQSLPSRIVGIVTDLPQVTKRMHNKALIADNQIAIIGGRNLGDEYFDADSEMAFRDIDVLTAGPVTAKISGSFDEYWNDDNSFPITTLYHREDNPQFLHDMRKKLTDNWNQQLQNPEGKKRLEPNLKDTVAALSSNLVWAASEFVADDPVKIETSQEDASSKPLRKLKSLADDAENEFIIISSYFVPMDAGVKWLEELEGKGTDVKVLTNSLASTDVVAVHTGYRRYRQELIEHGVDLYELKPVPGKRTKQRPLARGAPSYASLHTKMYIVDRKDIIVGSLNFDPRSYKLNTELALVIHSTEIAEQVYKLFEAAISPTSSYNLKVIDGNIVWLAEDKGQKVEYHSEPDSSMWRNVQTFFMSLLPIEDQL